MQTKAAKFFNVFYFRSKITLLWNFAPLVTLLHGVVKRSYDSFKSSDHGAKTKQNDHKEENHWQNKWTGQINDRFRDCDENKASSGRSVILQNLKITNNELKSKKRIYLCEFAFLVTLENIRNIDVARIAIYLYLGVDIVVRSIAEVVLCPIKIIKRVVDSSTLFLVSWKLL